MLKTSKYFFVVLAAFAVVFSSCDKNYKKTKSGLEYKYIEKGEGEPGKIGQYLILNMEYRTAKDSVLFPPEGRPSTVPIMIDSSYYKNEGGIEEAFRMLKKGDSVAFKVSADSLFEKTFHVPLPPYIEKGSHITFYIGVEDIIVNEEGFAAWQSKQFEKEQKAHMARQEEQIKKDKEQIAEYVKKNNLEAKVTESGLTYIMQVEGKGEQAKPGDTVLVNYTGNVLGGKVFDSSIEQVAKDNNVLNPGRPYQPLEFVLGQGMVIRGWDEGISLLKEGGKAKILIPSPLGYGEQSRGDIIKANSILEFDVELVDIK